MAAGNLSACMPVILANEGGFTDDPRDAGNWTGKKRGVGVLKGTNMGISAASFPNLDIKHLTKAEAESIYNRKFWAPAGCDVLPAGLDLSHFDATVLSGLGNSAKWLAKAKAAGPDTSTSVHVYAKSRLTSFKAFANWVTYGKGWSARIASVEAKSITMALGSAAPGAIAKAGNAAAKKAKVAGAAATASGAISVTAAIEAVHAHPMVGGAVALASFASWVWSKFHASTAGARAAALAVHAAG